MNRSDEPKSSRVASPVPRGGLLAMGLILLALVILSIYSNVQKARRDQIEKVTITPAAESTTPPRDPSAPTPP